MDGRAQERIEHAVAAIDETRLFLVDGINLPVPGPGEALEPQTQRTLLLGAAVLPGGIGGGVGMRRPIIVAVLAVGAVGHPFANRQRRLMEPLKLADVEVLPLGVLGVVVVVANVEGEEALQALEAVPAALGLARLLHVGPNLLGSRVDGDAGIVSQLFIVDQKMVVALQRIGALGVGHLGAQTVNPQHGQDDETDAADAPQHAPHGDTRTEKPLNRINVIGGHAKDESDHHVDAPADKAVPNSLGGALHHLLAMADGPVDQHADDAEHVAQHHEQHFLTFREAIDETRCSQGHPGKVSVCCHCFLLKHPPDKRRNLCLSVGAAAASRAARPPQAPLERMRSAGAATDMSPARQRACHSHSDQAANACKSGELDERRWLPGARARAALAPMPLARQRACHSHGGGHATRTAAANASG